jgi:hypothetical protein
MPIFIDEVIFRGEVTSGAASAAPAQGGVNAAGSSDRDALVSEVTQAVIDHLERALERSGERGP